MIGSEVIGWRDLKTIGLAGRLASIELFVLLVIGTKETIDGLMYDIVFSIKQNGALEDKCVIGDINGWEKSVMFRHITV